MISRHASNFPISPSDEAADAWPCQESPAYAGGDEREAEGSDRKQRKKKKRRQKDDGPYDNVAAGDNSPTSEEFYGRIGPRKDAGVGGWEEQLGKSSSGGGGRGKKGKSRKKIPEEWGLAEPFVPASEADAHTQAEVAVDLGSSVQGSREAYFPDGDASPSPWKADTIPDEGLVPAPLAQDLFSFTASPINPLAFSSELNATAPPFTMPAAAANSSPLRPDANDSFDLLMESGSADSVLPTGGDGAVDSGVFVQSGLLLDSETSAFSPASQSSHSQSPAVASAPPLSPSDASWLLNDSHVNSSSSSVAANDLFNFSEAGGLGISMTMDTPSPAPLRSPKTTAQEFHPKEGKSAQKAHTAASPSSPVKTATFPEEADAPLAESPGFTSSSPSSTPGSALNPSAKPFFPSFASSVDEDTAAAATVPPASLVAEGWFCCCKSRTLSVDSRDTAITISFSP